MSDATPRVIDARVIFECARLGHVPTLEIRPNIFIESFICTCARCGRVAEFKSKEPIRVG